MPDTTRPIPSFPDDSGDSSDSPTVSITPRWVASTPVPPRREPPRPRLDDTLDLPPLVEPEVPPVPPPPAAAVAAAAHHRPPPYTIHPPYPPYPPQPPQSPLSYPLSPSMAPPSMAPPSMAPPPMASPPRYRRRRRRWPWFMMIMALLPCICCAAAWRYLYPYVDQWPVTITADAEVSGLTTVTEPTRSKRATSLLNKIDSYLDQDSFVVLYTDTDNPRQLVTTFGVSRFIFSPDKDIDKALATLSGTLSITGLHSVDPGTQDGQTRCGTSRVEGQPTIVCGWADHGSLGITLFTNRDEDDCAGVMNSIRAAIIRR